MKIISYLETKTNLLIFISLFFHLTAVIFSIGSFHPDEYGCILEYVNTKFSSDAGPCFQHDRIRSWFQPFIYYLITKILIIANITDPFNWVFFYRLFSSVLGWSAIVLIIKNHTAFFTTRITINVFVFSSLFFWFYPFLHARYSTENFSSSFLLIGISILLYLIQNKLNHKIILLIIAGVFLGCAFASRYQIGIMILFFFIWSYLYKKFLFKDLAFIALGIILILIFEMFINGWGYNSDTFNWGYQHHLYFHEKIFNKDFKFILKDVNFLNYFPYLSYIYYYLFRGESLSQDAPWWYYLFVTTNKFFPPLSIVVILSFFYLWIFLRKNFLTWMTIPFIIFHAIIPHKEFRYMFPVLVLFPFVLSYVVEDIILNKKYFYKFLNKKLIKFSIIFFVFLNLLGLIFVSILPVDINIKFYKYFYKLENINEFYYYNNESLLSDEVRDPFYKEGAPNFFYHRLKTINTFSDINNNKQIVDLGSMTLSLSLDPKYEEKVIHKKRMFLFKDNQTFPINKGFLIHILKPTIDIQDFVLSSNNKNMWLLVNQVESVLRLNSLKKYCKIEFSTIPLWLLKFNINDWTKRAYIYSVFVCSK